VINEHDGSKVYTIEKQCRTFGQVMAALEQEGVKTNEIQLCNSRMNAPAFERMTDDQEILWGEQSVIELYAYEREYPVKVSSAHESGSQVTERIETFNVLKGTTISRIRELFEAKFGPGSLPDIHYLERQEDDKTLEEIKGFLDNPILIGKLIVDVADEKCNQIRHIPTVPHTPVGVIWKTFMKNATPPRVMHTRENVKGKPVPLCRDESCDGPHCPHTWLSYNGRFLLADDLLLDAVNLAEDDTHKMLYYNPPPFTITIREKNEKNEPIETKIEIEDSNTIAEVRNKYSRNAEEGLVDGDLLLLEDQELKEERMVFTYCIRRDSQLFVQKRSANQPMFTYTCADCGNDLRLRKDEKIRCRECGHRVVYKPRLNKPLQHFAR